MDGATLVQGYLFYVHDFSSHNQSNFNFFAAFYFLFYQTAYCQGLIFLTIGAIRSVLRHYVHRKEFNKQNG